MTDSTHIYGDTVMLLMIGMIPSEYLISPQSILSNNSTRERICHAVMIQNDFLVVIVKTVVQHHYHIYQWFQKFDGK